MDDVASEGVSGKEATASFLFGKEDAMGWWEQFLIGFLIGYYIVRKGMGKL